MYNTGYTKKLDHIGRLTIPQNIREELEIKSKTSIEFFIQKDSIVIGIFGIHRKCLVTGLIDENNIVFNGNIVLSREGIEILINEIYSKLNR